MTNTSLYMNLLNQLLGRVLRSADPTLLLLVSRWSDSWKKARINKAETDANVQLIEDVANAKSQLIKDVTKSISQIIIKAQADKLKTDGSAIGSDSISDIIEFQIEKKVANLIAIVKHAAKKLEGLLDIPNHDPNPAWTNRWVDGAQDVSSEELQKLWGKILAGEVKSPGQTSLRTLSILRDMTQQEAKDFSDLMRFRIDNFILSEALPKVLGKNSDSWMAHFSDIGLIDRIPQFFPDIMLGNDGKLVIKHCGHALIIQGRPGQGFSKLLSEYDTWGMDYNTCLITTAGLELAKLCQHEQPNRHYLSHLARFLDRYKCKLKLAEIINQNSESFQHSEPEIIQPFVEPEERNQEEPNNAE